MNQRHTDEVLPDWLDGDTLESYLERVAPIVGIQCCFCCEPIETRYYHENEYGHPWCNKCVVNARGMFWLRERGEK